MTPRDESKEEDESWGQTQKQDTSSMEVNMEVEDPDFDLEKAVCSHGFFMMAPNRWDPATRTFQRPLRLVSDSSTVNVFVRISQNRAESSSLRISVFGVEFLSFPLRESLLAQIKRMLRINKHDDQVVREFHMIHPLSREKGFGRVFRSPTLFEDMIKCILLCNCQWSRTLSMSQALCQLQSGFNDDVTIEEFQPRTPQKKEPKRKPAITLLGNPNEAQYQSPKRKRLNQGHGHNNGKILGLIGNFPSPEELAAIEEDALARRCNLGYRARRVRSLALAVVEKKIDLDEIEASFDAKDPSWYDMMDKRLSSLDGFGPFTRANALVCMGYYGKIPSDSETIRHLRQVHSLNCNIRVVGNTVEGIYGKFAPFQFLAYISELWDFYEKRFGKMSEMLHSDYQLITSSNMKGH